MTKRIGYSKIGRSLGMNPAKYGPQGDAEAPNLLFRLAARNPTVQFVIVGRHTEYDRSILPPNVYDPWPENTPRREDVDEQVIAMASAHLDGNIIHLGQHGTSHISIPMANDKWGAPGKELTKPLEWAKNYGEYLTRILNAVGDRTDGKAPVTWICTDPRNYMKARDVKWPTGCNDILSQHQYTRTQKHERFQDPRRPSELGFEGFCKPERDGELWVATHSYRHANLELMILDDNWPTWGQAGFDDRTPIGIASTSYHVPQDEWRRSWVINEFVLKAFPDTPVFGKWDDKSKEDVPWLQVQSNTVAQFPGLLGSWRCTVALPPTSRSLDGIEWTAAKPFQVFAAGAACFMIGTLDKQGWILPSRHKTVASEQVGDHLFSVRGDWNDEELALAQWLRVDTPDEFQSRAAAVASSSETWSWIRDAQRRTLQRRWDERLLERTIEYQQGIGEWLT